MRYFIVILLCIAFKADGQIIRANPFYTSKAVAVVTDTLLLDSFPAIVGYSLRKLRSGYTGNCIKVRRSSDNTTQDIGFVNNYLDTASMKTFVGNNNGFIDTWYSQGDSARNFTQTTIANQPRIINSGSVEYINNKLCLRFVDATDLMTVASSTAFFSFLHKTGQSAVFLNVNIGASSNPNAVYNILRTNTALTGGTGIYLNYDDRSSIPRNNNYPSFVSRGVSGTLVSGVNQDDYLTPQTFYLITNLFDNGNATLANRFLAYKNGGNLLDNTGGGDNPSTANASVNMQIGGVLVGYMNEIIIYNSDQSSNRTSIENNINRNWLIY